MGSFSETNSTFWSVKEFMINVLCPLNDSGPELLLLQSSSFTTLFFLWFGVALWDGWISGSVCFHKGLKSCYRSGYKRDERIKAITTGSTSEPE